MLNPAPRDDTCPSSAGSQSDRRQRAVICSVPLKGERGGRGLRERWEPAANGGGSRYSSPAAALSNSCFEWLGAALTQPRPRAPSHSASCGLNGRQWTPMSQPDLQSPNHCVSCGRSASMSLCCALGCNLLYPSMRLVCSIRQKPCMLSVFFFVQDQNPRSELMRPVPPQHSL